VKIALLIMLLLCSGCFVAGSPEIRDIGRYMSLQKGESTKHDVYRVFGQPYDVVMDQGTVWIYYQVKLQMSTATLIPFVGLFAGGTDTDLMTTKIKFDGGLMSGVETEQKSYYVNQWVGMTGNHPMPLMGTVEVEERVKAEMMEYGLPYKSRAERPEVKAEVKPEVKPVSDTEVTGFSGTGRNDRLHNREK
jgi:hypothetical protein